MKLKTIIFNNFRQFYGEQKVNLETTDAKNLIVIHAENNVGKTTFLKGFTWCLFKKESFKRKAYLNDYIFSQLGKGETAIASVTLIFDDRKGEYYVKRSIEVSNVGGKQYPKSENLEVKINGDIQTNQQDQINRILNPELSDYFFFEGESIGEMASPENKDEIKNGIQYIMGLEVYDRAVKHTGNARDDLRKSLRALEDNNNENTSPVAKKSDISKDIENEIKILEKLTKYIQHKEREKKDIRDRILKAEDVERFEREIRKYEASLSELQKEDSVELNSIKKLISKNAYLSMSQNTIKNVDIFLSKKRKKGELPSNIREQFVHDLLKKGECICGTPLNSQSVRKHLEDLLEKTVRKDIEDRFIDVNGFTSNHIDYKDSFIEQLNGFADKRKTLSTHLDNVNTQLLEEQTQRKENSGLNSQELITALEATETSLTKTNQSIGEHNALLKDLENKLKEVEKELRDYHAQSSKIDREEKRLTLAEDTLSLIINEYQQLTNKVREKLTEKVSEIFDSIIHGNYRIKINDKFELELTKIVNETEGETELSRGQEQIASLSFIAALVHIAKKWDEEHKQETWGGAGVYPMVMDSPFGTLGQFYQSSLTKKLRDLAPQIIVMVSSSQWTEEVSKNFSKYCQHEYVFQHLAPEDQNVQKYEDIIIDDGAYALEKVNEFEYTKIIEVK